MRPRYTFLLLSMLLVLPCLSELRAQHFSHLTTEEGLPTNLIISMLQDARGYLWIGTSGGLVRYDGYEVKVYRHEEGDATSLSDDGVPVLHETRDGTLWVGTFGGGLNRFDPDTETFTAFRHEAGDPQSLRGRKFSALFREIGRFGRSLPGFNR